MIKFRRHTVASVASVAAVVAWASVGLGVGFYNVEREGGHKM